MKDRHRSILFLTKHALEQMQKRLLGARCQVFPSTLADGGSRSLSDAVVPCRTVTTTMAIAT
jgi:hypothetical protein